MEELQIRHRKEAKDLQNRITSKKKQASKKTRKGVNDECDKLEQELKERQAGELAALNGEPVADTTLPAEDVLADGVAALEINGTTTSPSQDKADAPSPGPNVAAADEESAPTRKPNRAKARMVRRQQEQEALFAQASEEASNLPDLKAAERERMVFNFKQRGLSEKEIRADGHCLYSAFADQMDCLGLPLGSEPGPTLKIGLLSSLTNGAGVEKKGQLERTEEYKVVRRAAAEYMDGHREDFEPFLEEDMDTYVHKIRDTAEWGGQMELLALARSYSVQINVLQGDGRVEEIKPDNVAGEKVCWLAYYRHGFGLGEHYNSLRTAG